MRNLNLMIIGSNIVFLVLKQTSRLHRVRIVFAVLSVIILYLLFNIEHCEAQWEPDVRLTYNDSNSYTSPNNSWCIASNGNVVHVVWFDYRDGNSEIYYKRSADGGLTWSVDTRITNDTYSSLYPSITVSGSLVHIVWQDNRDSHLYDEIYYKRSTDGGLTWSADTRLTNNTSTSDFSSIAVSGTHVHVVWQDFRDGNSEIYYKRSTNAGVSWGTDTRLTNAIYTSKFPAIAVSGTHVHVVWQDSRDNNYEIYYKRSTDGGLNWGTDTRLTNNIYQSNPPSLAVSGAFIHIVWSDFRDGLQKIYYKRSTDEGTTWDADTRLTNYPAISNEPSIAVSELCVHIVWNDTRDGNEEIFYKISTDRGTTWDADTHLTNNSAVSRLPSIAVPGSNVYVVWQDNRNGNWDIYYKRNPTGNVSIKNISNEIPSAYSLDQNYPNPFNAVTNVKFQVPSLKFIKLVVFDLLGREVKTLVNEVLQPGTYSVRFNAGNLPSGIFFYQMRTDNFSESKKIILIK